ncbi:MAG: heparinase II/III-family protein [Kiritimatiellales bacterium]|nr:heparinase II/III-family protein [Kiritimatiellales bacterium]
MKRFVFLLFCLLGLVAHAEDEYRFTPENPVTEEWLQANLRKESPRLILTPARLATLKGRTDDPFYQLIKANADHLCDPALPVLKFEKVGKRLLSVSREAIRRISCLALVANMEAENQKHIGRLDAELRAVCGFDSWNPSHFLDVAEMSVAVAIGIDWCSGMLPAETIQLARQALLEKALKIKAGGVKGSNNWNQVCNGGLAAAALVVGDEHPSLAAMVVSRTLEYLPRALKSYAPDGHYPEGVSYWDYGTYYSALMVEMYRSALGTDFKLMDAPGFRESALFARMAVAPSGMPYNYFDCGSTFSPLAYWPLLAWFGANGTENNYFVPESLAEAVKTAIRKKSNVPRFAAIAWVWMVDRPESPAKPLPEQWVARGSNPIAVLRNNNDPRGFYLGCKGGKASLSHGNMDAGSFVYELDGVRWSVDLGMQGYTALEEVLGSKLWSSAQKSPRWQLISKSNFGHSTLAVNGQLHDAQAFSPLVSTMDGSLEIDLAPQFFGNVASAVRTFVKEGKFGVVVTDRLEPNAKTEMVTWQLMTQAKVEIDGNIVTMKQSGKSLKMVVEKPEKAVIKMIPLNPPPLPHDMKVKNLKRIEITESAKTGTTVWFKVWLEPEE